MRVLFINNSDIHGGAPRIAYYLKEELVRRGNAASMFVKYKYSNDPDVHLAAWPNPLNTFLKKLTGKDLGSVLSSKMHWLLATDIEWFNTDKILESEEFKKADLVHCHNIHGNYFKLDTLRKMSERKPVLWTFHDMWPITAHCGHAYGGKLENGFYQCPNLDTYQELLWHNEEHLKTVKETVYKRSHFHISVPSDWLKRLTQVSVLKDHPISLIYNGINENIFKPYDKAESRKLLSLPTDKKIVLFVSTHGASKEKGGAYFEEAVKHFSNRKEILFVCVGTDANQKGIGSDNVRYVPFVRDMEKLARFYSAADAFLFTSLAENFPLVVLEALACGTPVVSFDVGGVKEAVVHKENGYIAKYKNGGEVMQGLEYILGLTPEAYLAIADNARKKVEEHFTLKTMADNYFSLYEKLIRERKS